MADGNGASRREVIQLAAGGGGGLVLGFSLAGKGEAAASVARLKAYVTVQPDGWVEVVSKNANAAIRSFNDLFTEDEKKKKKKH